MSQLRNFSAYDKSAGISLVANPCTLVAIDGNYGGGGSEYYQIFDKASAPVANDVPIFSEVLTAAGPLPSVFEVLGPVNLTLGLAVGISSVNEKYTASASAYDVFGQTEEWETQISGILTVGDLSTGLNNLAVWTNAQGPKYLYQIDAIQNLGGLGNGCIMIFGSDSPVDGSVPFWQSPVLTASASLIRTFKFGYGGLAISHKIVQAIKVGCNIFFSYTPGTLTSDSNNTCMLRAKYKASGQTS